MKFKQLLIEMNPKDHARLKERAAELGVPMKRYVIDAIATFMHHERGYYRYREESPFDPEKKSS